MGILNNFFGSSKENKNKKVTLVNWIDLNSVDQLSEIEALSENETVAIFKHSTRCGISSMVIKSFVEKFDSSLKDFKVYYLDLLKYIQVSDEVGYKFQVIHQSPQLIIIKNKEVLTHASHYEITKIDLKSF